MTRRFISIFTALLAALIVFSAILPVSGALAASVQTAKTDDSAEISVLPQKSAADAASISANPAFLSGPGQVTISITLKNTSGAARQQMRIEDAPSVREPSEPTPEPTAEPTDAPTPTPQPGGGVYTNVSIVNTYGVSFNTSDVPAGESRTFTGTMNVTQEQIGETLRFTLAWFDTATQTAGSRELTLVISRADTAYLKLSRSVDKSIASAGDIVKLTYTMINTGAKTLNSITLVDKNVAGTQAMLPAFSLAPGESRVFTYEYTMRTSTVTSKPTVSFVPEGSTNALSVTLSGLTIGLINAQLTKTVEIGTPTPAGVEFTLYLTNNGNQSLNSLTVTDDLGAVVQSGFSLAIGESKTIKYFVKNPDAVRYVVFNITGVYSSGIVFKDNTKSYTVHPYIDPTTLGLEFRAEIRTQLNRENIIGLTFSVTNTGSTPYTDVILTEKELDYEIHRIAVLEPNSGAQTFNIDLNVGGERDLAFFLTALDASGNTHTFEAHLTAKYIDADGTVPDEPPVTDGVTVVDDPNIGSKLDGMLTKTGSALKVWYSILIIVAAAALIAIIALAAVEINKRKNGGAPKKPSRRQRKTDDEVDESDFNDSDIE